MTTKNDQLMKLVEGMVRKEVARIAPTIIREQLVRVMGNIILEAADSIGPSEPAPSPTGNGNKRRALQENTVRYEDDEWETLGGETMTSLSGIRGASPARTANPGRITVDSAISNSEFGNPVPINPNSIPDHLDAAFNRDYRALLKAPRMNGGKA